MSQLRAIPPIIPCPQDPRRDNRNGLTRQYHGRDLSRELFAVIGHGDVWGDDVPDVDAGGDQTDAEDAFRAASDVGGCEGEEDGEGGCEGRDEVGCCEDGVAFVGEEQVPIRAGMMHRMRLRVRGRMRCRIRRPASSVERTVIAPWGTLSKMVVVVAEKPRFLV